MRGRRVYELKSARERTPPRKEGPERQEARAMQAVYRLLGVRARSRRELERRLRQKGYPIDIVNRTLNRLEGLGFLNDREFARSLARARLAQRPMGERALRLELRKRGLEEDVVEEALGVVYSEESPESLARRAAEKKLRSLEGLSLQVARGKLEIFLRRRGFKRELAHRTAESLLGGEIFEDEVAHLVDNTHAPEGFL